MRTRRGERGQMAGLEALPFGVLVFLSGTLLALNAWAVIERRGAVDAAAAAYLRSYTSAPTAAEGRERGETAARASLGTDSTAADSLRIEHPSSPFGPCRVAQVVVRVDVPVVELPFLGSFGVRTASATQRELIQPFGAATPDGPRRTRPLAGTVCDA